MTSSRVRPRGPARVLLVDSSGYEDLGGASTVLNEVITRVDRARYIPVLSCLSPGRWPELVRAAGTAAYSFPRTRLRSVRNMASIVLGLRRVIRSEEIDLVHASENSALLYATVAARLTKTPVIWHIHSPYSARSRGERAVAWVLRRMRPAHVVFTSPGAQQRSPALAGIPSTVVFPGVDLERCRAGDGERGRRAFDLPQDALVLSMYARIEPMKGQVDFVQSLARLAPERPNLYAVMCGPADRSAAYWRRLIDLVERHDLAKRLVIPGDVRPPLKDDLVAGSDVVVHPSHAESFGLAVLEAMAAGRAVVAGATDGPRLLIEDDVDGVLVPPGDVDALTTAVSRLLDDPALRATLGSRACKSSDRYGADDMVRHMQDVWDIVRERQRRSRR